MSQRNGGKHLVIALFDNAAAGEVAARTIAHEQFPEGGSGAIGLLALDSRGNVKTENLGERSSGETPGVGSVLGVIAAALSGGVLPDRDHFFDARSDLLTDDISRLGAELEAGQAVVAVLDSRRQAHRAVVRLIDLGAKTEIHQLSRRALRQAATAPT